ncbi:MAG: CoB--CoM heterodisulfide reductase iron-sulfur subunit B family protein [Alkaliphilus sp.]
MKYSYFPGCTLHTQAKNFNDSIKSTSAILDIELEELEDWQCCGAVYPLATDSTMGLVSPYRSLQKAHECGTDLVTVCSACYNVLKRTNVTVANDSEIRTKLSNYMDVDEYSGESKVLHLLEAMKENNGFENIKEKTVNPLKGLKVAPYYGCLLLRPSKELEFDNPENPTMFEEFIKSMGATAIDFPNRIDCCGAYVSITSQRKVKGATESILKSATKRKADIIITSCPLCYYNLAKEQEGLVKDDYTFKPIPILYFTQLLALALGVESCGFESNKIDARPILKSKGLIYGGDA